MVDEADYTSFTRQHELDHTHHTRHIDHTRHTRHTGHTHHTRQEYICHVWRMSIMNCTAVVL